MDQAETAEFDEPRLNPESRAFAADLLARFPGLRPYAVNRREPGHSIWDLFVVVPAPSGDPQSKLTLFMSEGEPSVGFGRWHTHETVWAASASEAAQRESFLELIEGILADRIVLVSDIGGVADGATGILDLSVEDALMDELTSKYSPGRARLRSWSGALDRVVGLDDLG